MLAGNTVTVACGEVNRVDSIPVVRFSVLVMAGSLLVIVGELGTGDCVYCDGGLVLVLGN